MLHPDVLFAKGPVRLTQTQIRVTDFFLANTEQALFMTASQVGRELGVSDATVVRVAQTLGFNGLTQLKDHLRKQLMSRLDTVSRMEDTKGRIRSVKDILPAVMNSDLANLEQTIKTTSLDAFEEVVNVISRAETIHILGLRSAHSLAHFLYSALRNLGRMPSLLSPGIGYFWSDIKSLGPGAVLVAFSFPRYTKLTLDAVEEAKKTNVTVVSITDSVYSPLALLSDHVLPASFSMDSFMESFVAALSLLNALVTALAYTEGDESMRRLGNLEEMWRQKGVYFQDPESKAKGD